VDDHKEATNKFAVIIKTQAVKPPTKSVAGCNPASVNLFWTVYQNSKNFRYKSFLDSLIFAKKKKKKTPLVSTKIVAKTNLATFSNPYIPKMNFETE
jgi:hypothetical protein